MGFLRKKSIVESINGARPSAEIVVLKGTFATASLWDLTHSEDLLGYLQNPGYRRLNLTIHADDIMTALNRLWWSSDDKAAMSYKIEMALQKRPGMAEALVAGGQEDALEELRALPAMVAARAQIAARMEVRQTKKAAKMAARAA